MSAPMGCPVCGRIWHPSTGVYNSGFSAGKAVLGTVFFGPAGAVAGMAGNKKRVYTCSHCGYSKEYKI